MIDAPSGVTEPEARVDRDASPTGGASCREVAHLMLVRAALEPTVARLAATAMGPHQFLQLQQILDECAREDPRSPGRTFLEYEFHTAIACCCGHRRMGDAVIGALYMLSSEHGLVLSPGDQRFGVATLERTQIFKALVAGEPAQAEAAMRVHLANEQRALGWAAGPRDAS
jgi:DNA-binding FadR family transcriptional regulator